MASASRIRAGWRSHSLELPSISVKRNVTTPAGKTPDTKSKPPSVALAVLGHEPYAAAFSSLRRALSPQIAQDNVTGCGQGQTGRTAPPAQTTAATDPPPKEKNLEKSLVRVAWMLLAGAALAACSHSSSQSSASASPGASAPAGGAHKTIGVSIQNREAQFYQDMESGMRSEAAKNGDTLIVVDASRDNAKQQSQVEDFISKRVDAIVLTPYDSTAIGSAIAEANAANIPVFTADIASTSKQGQVVAHVASDNVQGGFAAGTLIC